MKYASILLVSLSALALNACGHYEPPPSNALDVNCDTGGRHGPSGPMDWQCVDGDGEERLRPQGLHEVIKGGEITYPDPDEGNL